MKSLSLWCISVLIIMCGTLSARPRTDEEKILEFMNKGQAHFKEKEFEHAESAYKEALAVDAGYADAHNALALVYCSQNRNQIAFTYAKKAISLDPENSRYLANMGLVYMKLKKNDEAEQILKRAIELDSKNYFGYVYLAEVTKRKANYPLAVKYADRAAELNLESYEPYKIKAEAYVGLEKSREAIQAYRRAQLKDSGNFNLYLACGNLYLELGENENARAQYRKALSIRRDEHDLRMKYAGVLKNDGEYDDAADEFSYVFRKGPENLKPESAYGAALSLYEDKDYEEAERYALESIKFKPDDNRYKKLLSDIYEKQGKLDKAAEVMPAPSEDAVNEYMALGLKWEKAGDHQKAADYYDKALQVDPGNAVFYLKKGLNLTKVEEEKEPEDRNYDPIINVYTEALDFLKDEPEISKIAYNLGKLYEEKGEYQQAFNSYKTTLNAQPSMVKAYFSAGYTYFRTSPWKKPLHIVVWGACFGFFFVLYIRHRKKIRKKLEKANEGK